MFSLVIPTHNRAAILKRSLAHLLQTPRIEDCEVIVIDDGSTDETPQVLSEFASAHPSILRVLTITNGGPARARNHGVRAASNDRILFIDDDVFPRPDMLQQHWNLLDAGFTGSQGLLLWHTDIVHTPLIRYIDSRGSQFDFGRVANPQELSFTHVYTGNFATCRNAVLDAGGFDESFFARDLGFSAYEDTILGYSMGSHGARLALNAHAVADHLHDMTEESFLRREFKVGYCTGRLVAMYPAIARQLGHERKSVLTHLQCGLLRVANRATAVWSAFSYFGAMRLRHREAFYRGLLGYEQQQHRKVTV